MWRCTRQVIFYDVTRCSNKGIMNVWVVSQLYYSKRGNFDNPLFRAAHGLLTTISENKKTFCTNGQLSLITTTHSTKWTSRICQCWILKYDWLEHLMALCFMSWVLLHFTNGRIINTDVYWPLTHNQQMRKRMR